MMTDLILLGNFSFAASLCELGHGANLTATAYDSKEVTLEKYPDAQENIDVLEKSGVTVLFQVDGTRLEKTKHFKAIRFEFIVFMFPHVGRGIKDMERNIAANQQLLSAFFSSAGSVMATESQIHVTIKQVEPYTLWRVKELAAENGLVCSRSFEFCPTLYPGYSHRRTLGFVEGVSSEKNEELIGKNCRTFCFSRPGSKTRSDSKDESSDGE
jgi:25S rRNA (uracil2634-N3)-methyltransferase